MVIRSERSGETIMLLYPLPARASTELLPLTSLPVGSIQITINCIETRTRLRHALLELRSARFARGAARLRRVALPGGGWGVAKINASIETLELCRDTLLVV